MTELSKDEMLALMNKPAKSNTVTLTGPILVPENTTNGTAAGTIPRIVESATKSEENLKMRLSKQPSTDDLFVSLIGGIRRTNSLLEQIRNILLNNPISPDENNPEV